MAHGQVRQQVEPRGECGNVAKSDERVKRGVPAGGQPLRRRCRVLGECEATKTRLLGRRRELADRARVEHVELGPSDLRVLEHELHRDSSVECLTGRPP
jgi:hypothetical protein